MAEDLDALAQRTKRLRTVRLALAVSGVVLAIAGRVTGSEPVLYAGAGALAALIIVRLVHLRMANRLTAQRFAYLPNTPARVALKKRIDLLTNMQIGLLSIGIPLVAVALYLGAPQAISMACVAVPLIGMLAGVHRQTLLGTYYSPYMPPPAADSAGRPR